MGEMLRADAAARNMAVSDLAAVHLARAYGHEELAPKLAPTMEEAQLDVQTE